jgi:hypothetical protein
MPCKDKIKQREHQRRHYRNHKEYYKNKRSVRRNNTVEKYNRIKSQQMCLICGENDPVVIDFHHLNVNEKERLIYEFVNGGRSWEKIILEIKKCVPLCANCHRKVHKYEAWKKKLRSKLPFTWTCLE